MKKDFVTCLLENEISFIYLLSFALNLNTYKNNLSSLPFLYHISLLFLVTVGALGTVGAQHDVQIFAGARGAAMGQTGLNFTDIHAVFSNPAGLAVLPKFSAALVATRPFVLADVNHFGLGAAYPTSSGTFALSAQYFGLQTYNEQRLNISYARKLVKGLRLGTQLSVLNTRISNYGHATQLTFGLGLQYQLYDKVNIATYVFNPIQVQVNEQDQLSTLYQLGMHYLPSNKLTINVEVEKDLNYDLRFKTGLEYQIIKLLYLRVGMATQPNVGTFGIGYQLKGGLQIDFSTSYHQVLGLTPTIGVNWQ